VRKQNLCLSMCFSVLISIPHLIILINNNIIEISYYRLKRLLAVEYFTAILLCS